jgi:hypothetical protein
MPFKHNGSRGRLDALFLFPSALAFAESCGSMSLAEYGQVIVKAPEILRCNWSTNLSRKLEFLSSTLNVPSDGLKLMTT